MSDPSGLNYSFDFDGPSQAAPEPATLDRLVHFLALGSISGLGRLSLCAIFDEFPYLGDVWDASSYQLERILRGAKNRGAEAVTARIFEDASKVLDRAEDLAAAFARARISVVFRDSPEYPEKLRKANGPRWLFVQGNLELLSRHAAVAVVGTRTPSPAGIETARELASQLAGDGFVVISGLADGIDAEVHTAVVDCAGETIAVLGNGLNVEFPAGSSELRRRILQTGGAVVTEYLWNERYSKSSFVERNRIQAALSGAVFPVECKRKSGTAHTIRFATELKRPVAGVKWRPLPPPGNEVFDVLRDLSAPVFDLGDKDGLPALQAFLSPIAVDVKPPSADQSAQRRRIYSPPLKQLREILARRKPSDEERRWLLEVVARLLALTKDGA